MISGDIAEEKHPTKPVIFSGGRFFMNNTKYFINWLIEQYLLYSYFIYVRVELTVFYIYADLMQFSGLAWVFFA